MALRHWAGDLPGFEAVEHVVRENDWLELAVDVVAVFARKHVHLSVMQVWEGVGPIRLQMWEGVSPVPVQMWEVWEGWAP